LSGNDYKKQLSDTTIALIFYKPKEKSKVILLKIFQQLSSLKPLADALKNAVTQPPGAISIFIKQSYFTLICYNIY